MRKAPGGVCTDEEGMLAMLCGLASSDTLHQMSATIDQCGGGLSEMDNAMHELVYPYAKRALHVEMWESELP